MAADCWLRYDTETDKGFTTFDTNSYKTRDKRQENSDIDDRRYAERPDGKATESMLLCPSCIPDRHMLHACTRAQQDPHRD